MKRNGRKLAFLNNPSERHNPAGNLRLRKPEKEPLTDVASKFHSIMSAFN